MMAFSLKLVKDSVILITDVGDTISAYIYQNAEPYEHSPGATPAFGFTLVSQIIQYFY